MLTWMCFRGFRSLCVVVGDKKKVQEEINRFNTTFLFLYFISLLKQKIDKKFTSVTCVPIYNAMARDAKLEKFFN